MNFQKADSNPRTVRCVANPNPNAALRMLA